MLSIIGVFVGIAIFLITYFILYTGIVVRGILYEYTTVRKAKLLALIYTITIQYGIVFLLIEGGVDALTILLVMIIAMVKFIMDTVSAFEDYFN